VKVVLDPVDLEMADAGVDDRRDPAAGEEYSVW
jgi:hypothetical protein